MSKRELPDWAEKFDNWGKKRGETRPAKREKNRIGEYIFSIIVNAALVFAAHRLPGWISGEWFLADKYLSMLWTLDLSFATHIAGNFMLIFYRPRYIRRLASLMFNTVSIVFLSTFLKIFPVDVPSYGEVPINLLIRIGAIAGLVGSGIAAVVNLIRFIVSSIKSGFEEDMDGKDI